MNNFAQTLELRLNICKECPQNKMVGVLSVCNQCGCPIVTKALLPKPTCPLKKWAGQESSK